MSFCIELNTVRVRDAHPEQLCYKAEDLCKWFYNGMRLLMTSIRYTALQTDLQKNSPSCETQTDHQLQQHFLKRVEVSGNLCA